MIRFPIRGEITADEYRARCRSSDMWSFLDEMRKGSIGLFFPPGSVTFGLVGLLIIPAGVGVVVFLSFGVLSSISVPARAIFMFASSVVIPVIHCAFMMPVSLGFLYAQQNLVYYLSVLFGMVLGVWVYGVYKIAAGDVRAVESIFLVISLAASLAMLRLSRSLRFTLYAEFLRMKRVYMHELKKQAKPKNRPI